jgi:hypothetical protein
MKIKPLIMTFGVGALVVHLFLQRSEINRLRVTLAELKTAALAKEGETPETSPETRAHEAARLEAEHAELMQLRAEAAAFRQAKRQLAIAQDQLSEVKQKLQTSQTETESRHIKLAEGLKGSADFRNLGHTSPTESFETALWASSSQETNVLAQSIAFDGESRARADHLFTNAPLAFRNHFANVEQAIAYLLSKTMPVVGMRIFEEEPISPGKVRLQTEWQYQDGRVQPNSFTFLQANNGGWQMLIEPGMVNKLGRMMDEEGLR